MVNISILQLQSWQNLCCRSEFFASIPYVRQAASLNTHVHFHICVVDGVFEPVDGEDGSQVKFHALAHLSADAIAQVQNEANRRIVRAFVKRGLLDSIDGEVMFLARHGGGFSVDASVCIAGAAIRKILDHIGVASSPPKISKACGPPLSGACDEAEPKDYFKDGTDYEIGQQWPDCDDDVDQSVNW